MPEPGEYGRAILAALDTDRRRLAAALKIDEEDLAEALAVNTARGVGSFDADFVWLALAQYIDQRIAGCLAIRQELQPRLEKAREERMMRLARVQNR